MKRKLRYKPNWAKLRRRVARRYERGNLCAACLSACRIDREQRRRFQDALVSAVLLRA